MRELMEQARGYVARGWSVIPIPYGSKSPIIERWQEIQCTEQDLARYFNGQPMNIGRLNGAPSGGTVDVDLDAPEALAAADDFLPSTDCIYGRKSKPRSHREYVVAPVRGSARFEDPAGGMLVELRSTGTQSLVPPSMNPAGETVEWERDGRPAELAWETLQKAVGYVAAAALLARRWPAQGIRHEFSLAVAGFLLRGGCPQDLAAKLVECAARIAATDEEWRDRPRDVHDTARRMAEGIAVTGGRRLTGFIPDGARVVETLRKWLQLRVPSFHLTDLGNTERFIAQHAADVRYCWTWQSWLVWDGRRWRRDPGDAVMQLVKETVRSIYAEAQREPDETRRKTIAAWAMRSESAGRLSAILTLARSEPGISVTPEALDRSPYLLNCLNGTLELRTLALRPHRRDDLLTKCAAAAYDPDAGHPVWTSFLERVLPDPEMRSFMQRWAGYALTGDTAEEKLTFLHGPTASGKTTFTGALRNTWGDYAETANFDSFLAEQRHGPREDLARLAGARLVLAAEVEEGSRLAEALVKKLTGGDSVTARRLYEDSFEFKPAFKLVLAANHRPRVRDDDDAIWRRILEIPFRESIAEPDRDPAVKRTLFDPSVAGSAVLAWAAQGAATWYSEGLGTVPAIERASREYRQEMDPLRDFIAECCTLQADAWAGTTALWDRYQAWCRESGERRPLTRKTLPLKLRSLGCTPGSRNHGRLRVWTGIALTDPVTGGDG